MSYRPGPCGPLLAFAVALAWAEPLRAQTTTQPAGPEASFPTAAPAAPGPAPTPPAAAAAPTPAVQPATAAAPAPAAQPAPAAPSPAAAPAAPAYEAPPPVYEPPPPPPQKPADGFSRPLLSFRVDALTLVFEGRLPLEMEMQIWKFISVEVVPVFVLVERSPSLKGSFDSVVTQHSNGIGAMSGASFGVGFWLSGKAMQGTVLRAILADYGYTYRASDERGKFDEVSHTDRHFYGFIGSHSTWGVFTLAGGLGFGVELNKERRCFTAKSASASTTDRAVCTRDEQLIALARTGPSLMDDSNDTGPLPVGDLHSFTYPIEIMGRFSLGVSF